MIDVIKDEELGCIYILEKKKSGEYVLRVFEHFDSAVGLDTDEIVRRIKDIRGFIRGSYFVMGYEGHERGDLFRHVHVIRLGKVFPKPYERSFVSGTRNG